MFKKPVCPYCGAIYDSKEIKNQNNGEKVKCHNCKKIFTVKKTEGLIFLVCMAVAVAILVNMLLLTVIKVRNVIPLFVVTVIILIVALLFRVYFVKYKKEE